MGMQTLSEKLDACAALLQGEVIYLDYPAYDNVGDILIWMGARALMKRHNINLKAQFGQRLGLRAHYLLSKCTTICLQGGGNFGDLYPNHQKFREDIIQKYPDKRIVIFPQSIHFQDKRKLDETCRILKKHPDLHICLRDRNSFALLQDQDVPNLWLVPDTAHALYPITPSCSAKPNSQLYLLRRDKENAFLPQDVSEHKHTSVDWADFLKGFDKTTFDFALQLNRIDGRLMGNMLPAYTVWNWEANRLLKLAINLFSVNEAIVTNRLHAMILSALMGKKCTVYDNSYGKLSSYHELWLQDIDHIDFVKPQKDGAP